MALTPEVQGIIVQAAQAAHTWHKDISQFVTDSDVLINGANNWLANLTQENIDADPALHSANLQRAEVLAVLHQLKQMAAIPGANDLAAFIKLANLQGT